MSKGSTKRAISVQTLKTAVSEASYETYKQIAFVGQKTTAFSCYLKHSVCFVEEGIKAKFEKQKSPDLNWSQIS